MGKKIGAAVIKITKIWGAFGRQTDRITEPPSTVLVCTYIFKRMRKKMTEFNFFQQNFVFLLESSETRHGIFFTWKVKNMIQKH